MTDTCEYPHCQQLATCTVHDCVQRSQRIGPETWLRMETQTHRYCDRHIRDPKFIDESEVKR